MLHGSRNSDEALDVTATTFVGRAAFDGYALAAKLFDRVGERRRARDFPADVAKLVALSRVDGDAIRALVDPQVDAVVGLGPERRAEDLRTEALPLLGARAADADVAER